MNNPTVIAWLADAGTWLAFALLAACLAYAIALLMFPAATLELSAALNRRYSSRRALRSLEIPRATEPFFYRHHRLVGGLLLAGVVAFFLLFAFGYPRDTVLEAIARETGGALAGAVIDAAEWFLLGANALIGVFALTMLLRPSALKPLEAWANRWVSTRQALREAEQPHEPVDDFFACHPRLGALLVLAGLAYIAISLLI
ncbi:MAG TPA: hypothetical protein VF254_02470, partial [Gammaproteobacteria bacterium]